MKRWFAVVLLLGVAQPVMAQTQSGANLLRDGGYERWDRFVPKDAGSSPVVADALAPAGWDLSAQPGTPRSVMVARDAAVRHGGAYSIRLTNAGATDIGAVTSRQIEVLPNQAYKFRVWYKAKDITAGPAADAGIRLVVSQADADSQGERSVRGVTPKTKDGTFDWRAIEVNFTTKPTTRYVIVGMQLRQAKGTAWFDDAELSVARIGATTSVLRRERASAIFQADFNGAGEGEGGANDIVTLGGTAKLTSGARMTPTISAERPLGTGGGSYLNAVTAAGAKWLGPVQFRPSPAGSFSRMYSRSGNIGRLNGAFEIFVRPNKIPTDNGNWLWPVNMRLPDASHRLHVLLSGMQRGIVRFQLISHGKAFSHFRVIPSPDGVAGHDDYDEPKSRAEIHTRKFMVDKPGQTYHLAWTLQTDSQGVVLMQVFAVEGSGPIDSATPLGAATFRLDAAVVGDVAFDPEGWGINTGDTGAPLDIDYDGIRVYDRVPGVFPGLDGSSRAN